MDRGVNNVAVGFRKEVVGTIGERDSDGWRDS